MMKLDNIVWYDTQECDMHTLSVQDITSCGNILIITELDNIVKIYLSITNLDT